MRGDGVVCIGEVDDNQEKIDWLKVKGSTLKSTRNTL
ncbi:uncharacterized protein PRCAT00000946001 [Priceomyces carsonii]|nr:unnamed protein product [Priceomyces carsonii]